MLADFMNVQVSFAVTHTYVIAIIWISVVMYKIYQNEKPGLHIEFNIVNENKTRLNTHYLN